jgi:hypothetical protein
MDRRQFSRIFASTVISGLVGDAYALRTDRGQSEAGLRDAGGYATRQGMSWRIGTSKVEQVISLSDGRFILSSFRNKLSGKDYSGRSSMADLIRLRVDGVETSSEAWRWAFAGEHQQAQKNGELQFDIQLQAGTLTAIMHCMIYPGSGIIRQWITLRNTSQKGVRISDLSFLNAGFSLGNLDQCEFGYLSGGGNFNGSQLLKTEPMHSGYRKTLDSNVGVQTGNYSAYLPLILLRNIHLGEYIAIGWDYLGHWAVLANGEAAGQVDMRLLVAGYDGVLEPDASIETPRAFIGALTGDLDAAGNQILDWQYRYLWDFTNPDYFGKTRWAVDWPSPWVGNGGTPCADNWGRRLSLDLRYVDLLRAAGGDILWDDAGWYDKWGNWYGPDWRLTTDYLKKCGMGWVLWQPSFLATTESEVGRQHPDWIIPGQMVFEQSIPATREWQQQLLDADVKRWGEFQYRYDIAPAASASDTKLMGADQEFRRLLEQFRKSHLHCGVDACDGGGRWISYDLARLADSGECTDGGVGPYSGHYSSLLISPDKLHNVVDFDHTSYRAASDRTHLAIDPVWYRDPGDGEDVESIRKDWELYRYLLANGVAGRWSHVFRPRVTGDDAVWYFQRMNASGSRGIVIAKHAKAGCTYLLVSKPLQNTGEDQYEGAPAQMAEVVTMDVAALDTGIYEDPIDGEHRYYGVPGETFGPLNFLSRTQQGEQPYVARIARHGAVNRVQHKFFGMAFQVTGEPVVVTELGQFDPGNNRGSYELTLLRAADKAVLGSVRLDMSRTHTDSAGFKYARLSAPIRLEPELETPVVVYPNGLEPKLNYDVRAYHSGLGLKETGARLMAEGISLSKILPGELIFLNLPNYPGSGTDTIKPLPPSGVTKRVGTNIGAQGIEVSWHPAMDNNWVSYYEVLKNGASIARCAKGTFFFDHAPDARYGIEDRYEVRTVDGDGNQSALVAADRIPGDPEIHQPLGEYWPTQGRDGWKYEETLDGEVFTELHWQDGGYEGYWAGSGQGRIGRIWMQPSGAAELARTFIAPSACSVSIHGQIEKDPSIERTLEIFARIERNHEQIWPASEWASVPIYGDPLRYDLRGVALKKDDVVRFVIKRSVVDAPAPIVWNPIIVVEREA